jgi:hypothetical protein
VPPRAPAATTNRRRSQRQILPAVIGTCALAKRALLKMLPRRLRPRDTDPQELIPRSHCSRSHCSGSHSSTDLSQGERLNLCPSPFVARHWQRDSGSPALPTRTQPSPSPQPEPLVSGRLNHRRLNHRCAPRPWLSRERIPKQPVHAIPFRATAPMARLCEVNR